MQLRKMRQVLLIKVFFLQDYLLMKHFVSYFTRDGVYKLFTKSGEAIRYENLVTRV